MSNFAPQRATTLYNAACCHALNNHTDSALLLAQKAVEAGYGNREQFLSDPDLASIRETPAFKSLIRSLPLPMPVNTNPARLSLVIADLHHFWEAYDKAKGDSALLEKYMRQLYFAQASKGMKGDTTNLKYAIVEGMADFIGELISGKVANPGLHRWAGGQEKRIWNRFKAGMFNKDYNAWIANSGSVPEGKAADQGYWVGYQILPRLLRTSNG